MEHISSFTYCDSIRTEMTQQGPRSKIIKPLKVLAPIAIPGNYSFSIACNLTGFDAAVENHARIKFLAPDGQIINDTGEVRFQIPANQIKEGRQNIMQFNLDMRNMVFREAGTYTTKIYLNQEEVGSYDIPVVLGKLQ